MTYEKAIAELQEITQALENEAISIDNLTAKVKRAKTLIAWCKEKLKDTASELEF